MKKGLQKAAYIAIGIFLLAMLSTLLMPNSMEIDASETIDAPVQVVYQQVYDLRNWDNWAPWRMQQTDMEISYSNPPSGKGAFFVWSSNRKRVGNGKMTITRTVPNRQLDAAFAYDDWHDGTMSFTFESVRDNRTKVLWSATNEIGMNPFTKYAAMLSFKPEARRMFRKGLDNLKNHSEGIYEHTPSSDQ